MQLDAIYIYSMIYRDEFLWIWSFWNYVLLRLFRLVGFYSLHSSFFLHFFALKSSEHLLYVSIYNETIFAINKLFKIMMMRIFPCESSNQPKIIEQERIRNETKHRLALCKPLIGHYFMFYGGNLKYFRSYMVPKIKFFSAHEVKRCFNVVIRSLTDNWT